MIKNNSIVLLLLLACGACQNYGNDQLVLTDSDFDPLVTDARYTLYKRSELFTAEGYVTIETDSLTTFFERNTSGNWHVAHLGVYDQVKDKYQQLATTSLEGIYLRALIYSVNDTNASGEPTKKLVVKRIVEMKVQH